jgi:hypothetical protein
VCGSPADRRLRGIRSAPALFRAQPSARMRRHLFVSLPCGGDPNGTDPGRVARVVGTRA